MTGTDSNIHVLSYNISGHSSFFRDAHGGAIARLIEAERPDLVGLQEVHRGTWQSRFRDQAAELASSSGMTLHFGASFRGFRGEFGNAVLTRGTVLAGEVTKLPGRGEPRSLLRAEVDLGGLVLDFFVTHLAAWGGLSRRSRSVQAASIVERVRDSPRPWVLCGDLNAPPGATELDVLVRNDLVQLCGVAAEPTHALLGRRLDYIFAAPAFEVVDAKVLRRGPSDHWPVRAELRFKGAG